MLPAQEPSDTEPASLPQGNLPQQRSPELIVWCKTPQTISFCLFAYKFNSLVAEKSSPARFWLHFVFFLPLGVDFATSLGARCHPRRGAAGRGREPLMALLLGFGAGFGKKSCSQAVSCLWGDNISPAGAGSSRRYHEGIHCVGVLYDQLLERWRFGYCSGISQIPASTSISTPGKPLTNELCYQLAQRESEHMGSREGSEGCRAPRSPPASQHRPLLKAARSLLQKNPLCI